MRNVPKETDNVHPVLCRTLTISTAGIAFVLLLGSPAELALGQTPAAGSQQTPSEIPEFEVDGGPTGKIATYQPGGPTDTASNAFFQNLGTNGRICFTCHQPQNGWTISAAGAQARFAAGSGTGPLFRLVDGATCPTADVSNPNEAYKLVINKGLIRIAIQLPPNHPTEH